MNKLFLLLLLASLKGIALTPQMLLHSPIADLEMLLVAKENYNLSYRDSIQFSFDKIADNPANLIDASFAIAPFFKKSVNFWFDIYANYKNHHVVIHDKNDLSRIYKILDFSELTHISNPFIRSQLQNKLTNQYIAELKAQFRRKKILAADIRTQTGLYENIENSFSQYQLFREALHFLFEKLNVPIEVISIPFIESGFMHDARSRSGAVGMWQFLHVTGQYFMSINDFVDHRLNPYISTIGALHLLKQNKMILKFWNLAVVAFNTGANQIIQARRALKKKSITLQELFNDYSHPMLGFAAQNYYSEFLAMTYYLFYYKKLSRISTAQIPQYYLTNSHLNDLVEKGISPELNPHLLKDSAPKKTIIVSRTDLPPTQFTRIPEKILLKKYPKDWRSYNCSTK